ncbi:MAG: hypothetical protein C4B58_15655, partial [Deltaproteobacteria bacterium]
PECQKARRRKWQKEKLATDEAYRANQADCQMAWRQRNPDYWRRYRVLPQFILPAKSRDKIPVKRVGSTILSFPAIGLKKHLIISSQYRPLDNNLSGHGSGNFVRGCA